MADSNFFKSAMGEDIASDRCIIASCQLTSCACEPSRLNVHAQNRLSNHEGITANF